MKKIIYSSLVVSLLLVGCSNKNETEKDIELTNEEKQILEEIKDGENLSVTGNDLNISDKEKDYNFRLRIIDIHNLYMSYMLYNIPNLNKSDSFYINKYASEDSYYQQDGELMKKVLTDIQYYDPKFNEEEEKLNKELNTMIDLFGNFFKWTNKEDIFVESETDKDGNSYFSFNKDKYDVSDYENKVKELNNYLSQELMNYFYYSVHFLNEADKEYTKEELLSYLTFESSLYGSKELIEQQMNIILDRKSSKAKKEESWHNLKREIEVINSMNIDKNKLINIHIKYFDLLDKFTDSNSYDESTDDLLLLEKWHNNDDFLNNYSVENLLYIQTFIDYYRFLYFNEED